NDLDEIAPLISLGGPIAGDDIVDASEVTTVTFSGTSDEEGGLVTLTLDDGLSPIFFNPTVSSGLWSVTVDLTGLQEGSVIVTADISDVAGNAAIQASSTITLDYSLPTISGTTNPSIVENTTIVGMYNADEAVTWSLSGDDASLFTIDGSGNVSFITAPDFEVPSDLNTDNVYDLVVEGTDASINVGILAVAVTITDEDENAPAFSSAM
ncbi:MAG: hypothetical protein JXR10_18325, partial [Cyclobacteriaceae bacterium]